MIFKNVKNNQVANIVDEELISNYMNDTNWIILEKYNFPNEEIEFNENNFKMSKIKKELVKLSEDIIQYVVGEDIPDINDKKNKFVKLHNELRYLEGKDKRQIRSNINCF